MVCVERCKFPILLLMMIATFLPMAAQEGMGSNPKSRGHATESDQPEPASWKDPDSGIVWTRNDNGLDILLSQAETYCAGLPHPAHSAWRLPEIFELDDHLDNTMHHFRGYDGSADQFLAGPSNFYILGVADGPLDEKSQSRVNGRALCVYDSSGPLESSWTNPKTSLIWSRTSMTPAEWQVAFNYCKALVLDGQAGWRLPTISELQTLYDSDRPMHPYGELVLHRYGYWSSTSVANDERSAFIFEIGSIRSLKIVPYMDSGLKFEGPGANSLCVRSR